MPVEEKITTKSAVRENKSAPLVPSPDSIIAKLHLDLALRKAVRDDTVERYLTGKETNSRIQAFFKAHPEFDYTTSGNENNPIKVLARNSADKEHDQAFYDLYNATRIASSFRSSFKLTFTDEQGLLAALVATYSDKGAGELVPEIYKKRYGRTLVEDLEREASGLGGLAKKAVDGNPHALLSAIILSSLASGIRDGEGVINLYRGLSKEIRQEVEKELSSVVKNHKAASLDEFYKKLIPDHLVKRFEAVRLGDPDRERALRFQAKLDVISLTRKDVTPMLDELARLSHTSVERTFAAAPELKEQLKKLAPDHLRSHYDELLKGNTGPYTKARLESLLMRSDSAAEWDLYTFSRSMTRPQSDLLEKYLAASSSGIVKLLSSGRLDQVVQDVVANQIRHGSQPSDAEQIYISIKARRSGSEIGELLRLSFSRSSPEDIDSNYQRLSKTSLYDAVGDKLPREYSDIYELLLNEKNKDVLLAQTKLAASTIDNKKLNRLLERTADPSLTLEAGYIFKAMEELDYNDSLSSRFFRFEERDAFHKRKEAFNRLTESDDLLNYYTNLERMSRLATLDSSLYRQERTQRAKDFVDTLETAAAAILTVSSAGSPLSLLPRALLARAGAITGINTISKCLFYEALGADLDPLKVLRDAGIDFASDVAQLGTRRGLDVLKHRNYTKLAEQQLNDLGRRVTKSAVEARVIRMAAEESPFLSLKMTAASSAVSGITRGTGHALAVFSDLKLDPAKDPTSFYALALEDAITSVTVSTLTDFKRQLSRIEDRLKTNRYKSALNARLPDRSLNTKTIDTAGEGNLEVPTTVRKKTRGGPRDESGVRLSAPEAKPKKGSGVTQKEEKPPQLIPKAELSPTKINSNPEEKSLPQDSVAPSASESVTGTERLQKTRTPKLTPKQRKKLLEGDDSNSEAISVTTSTTPAPIAEYNFRSDHLKLINRQDRILAEMLLTDGVVSTKDLERFGSPLPNPVRLSSALKALLNTKTLPDLHRIYPSLEKLSSSEDIPYYSIKPAGAGRQVRLTFYLGPQGPEGISFSKHYGDH